MNYNPPKNKFLSSKGGYFPSFTVLYEGEYLRGKKNGKGKEYNEDDKLIFEGEYLNGRKWNGNMKEYFKNGFLKLEVKYLNGEKNGEVKEYNINGNLKWHLA